jgi:hypothetical protein
MLLRGRIIPLRNTHRPHPNEPRKKNESRNSTPG